MSQKSKARKQKNTIMRFRLPDKVPTEERVFAEEGLSGILNRSKFAAKSSIGQRRAGAKGTAGYCDYLEDVIGGIADEIVLSRDDLEYIIWQAIKCGTFIGRFMFDELIGVAEKRRVADQIRNSGKKAKVAARRNRWIARAKNLHAVRPDIRSAQVAKEIAADEKRRKIADRRGWRTVQGAIRHIFEN